MAKGLVRQSILGVIAFTVSASLLAVKKRFYFFGVFIAGITASGGGVLRDILAGEMPFVLRREAYAAASIAGACVFYLAQGYPGMNTAGALCLLVTCGICLPALRYKLKIPQASLRKPNSCG